MRVKLKILVALAMPIVTAGLLGGVLEHTHHTKLPPLAAPSPSPQPLSTHVMRSSSCASKLTSSGPFAGVAVQTMSTGAVSDFAAVTRSHPSIVEFYNSFPGKFVETSALEAVGFGAIPFVQLNPGRFNKHALRKIANGKDDKAITAYAQAVRAFGYCIIISFGHEMNGWWYDWGAPSNTPATFKKAWRHVHDLFVAAHADNVIWSWDPSHQYTVVNSKTHSKLVASLAGKWYPGSQYVDWIGLDGYLSLDHNGAPQNFDEIFGPQVANIRSFAPHKLLYLAETGVGSNYAMSEQVAQINELFQGIAKDKMGGLIWFELNRKNSWSLKGRRAAIQAYRSGLKGFPVIHPIDHAS